MDTICKYGKAVQDAATCKMIYIHISGYYETGESFQMALKLLCPNYIGREDKANDEKFTDRSKFDKPEKIYK